VDLAVRRALILLVAVHINMMSIPPGLPIDTSQLDEVDQETMKRFYWNEKYEFGYNMEHATKTSTIAMVVSSDPVAMLAWYVSSLHVRA
jgi:microsomal epoxide hydrolase